MANRARYYVEWLHAEFGWTACHFPNVLGYLRLKDALADVESLWIKRRQCGQFKWRIRFRGKSVAEWTNGKRVRR